MIYLQSYLAKFRARFDCHLHFLHQSCFSYGKPKAQKLPQGLTNVGISLRTQGSWEEDRGNEAGCRVQWKMHKMCLNIVLWLFPMSAFSLQLGHRFLEGRHPARDICMPNGTSVPSHRANGSVQTCWAEQGWGRIQGRKGKLPSTWRLGLGVLVPGKCCSPR